MIITNSRYALVGYFITSYPTRAHGIIVIYFTFGLPDYDRYIEEFVISRNSLYRGSLYRGSLYRGSLYRGSTVSVLKNSFSCSGSIIWNNPPCDIGEAQSLR